MLDQPELDYIYNFPIDLEQNGIPFGSESIIKCVNYNPNLDSFSWTQKLISHFRTLAIISIALANANRTNKIDCVMSIHFSSIDTINTFITNFKPVLSQCVAFWANIFIG